MHSAVYHTVSFTPNLTHKSYLMVLSHCIWQEHSNRYLMVLSHCIWQEHSNKYLVIFYQ